MSSHFKRVIFFELMIKNKIQPLFDNILIRPLEAQAKTASGIILPDTAQEKPQMGEVVAVGPGKVTPKGEKEAIVVKVGQKVMYKKWAAQEIKVDGEELLLAEQKDILAIIE
jgi:chaperonin GroES